MVLTFIARLICRVVYLNTIIQAQFTAYTNTYTDKLMSNYIVDQQLKSSLKCEICIPAHVFFIQ